jgi:RND family efflux transporter MFP subunit
MWLLLSSHSAEMKPVDHPASSPSAEVIFPVKAGIARRGDLIRRLTTTGIVRARRDVEIIARVSGQGLAVKAYNGKYVKAGELLVKIDDREYSTAFERAGSNLLGAQIEYRTLSNSPYRPVVDSVEIQRQLAASRAKFQDAGEAYRSGTLTHEEYARLEREYEANVAYLQANRGDVIANKSGLTQAREAYEIAKANLEATEVCAPFSGYVANCDLTAGMLIQQGRVLCSIVDESTLLVDVEILENEVGSVVTGQLAEVSAPGHQRHAIPGIVRTMNPLVDEKTKTLKVTIELFMSGRSVISVLRPGMFVSVRIVTGVLRHQVLVPHSALLVRDERALVFTKEGDEARWHYVEAGEENDEFVAIKSGILPGDTVITEGHFALADDARISLINE